MGCFGILSEFLRKHRSEVLGMLLEEFDAEKYERAMKREGYEEGHAAGLQEGQERGIAIGRSIAILTILEQKGTIPDDLKEKILSQKDEMVLKQWLLVAAATENIESFREKAGI